MKQRLCCPDVPCNSDNASYENTETHCMQCAIFAKCIIILKTNMSKSASNECIFNSMTIDKLLLYESMQIDLVWSNSLSNWNCILNGQNSMLTS